MEHLEDELLLLYSRRRTSILIFFKSSPSKLMARQLFIQIIINQCGYIILLFSSKLRSSIIALSYEIGTKRHSHLSIVHMVTIRPLTRLSIMRTQTTLTSVYMYVHWVGYSAYFLIIQKRRF